MSGVTLLVPPNRFDGDRYEIEGDDYRHLFRARRLAAGACVRVVDGRGRARWARVSRVERRRAVLELDEAAPTNEPGYGLDLAVAALRPERASWLVEKATELGVRRIRFIATERTPREYGPRTIERLRRVAAAALQQCHRSLLPEVSGVEPWEETAACLRRLPEAADRFYLDTGAADSNWGPSSSSGAVLVGPEGGFCRAEAAALERRGCQAVSLGPRTLRVETAAVAAATRLLLC